MSRRENHYILRMKISYEAKEVDWFTIMIALDNQNICSLSKRNSSDHSIICGLWISCPIPNDYIVLETTGCLWLRKDIFAILLTMYLPLKGQVMLWSDHPKKLSKVFWNHLPKAKESYVLINDPHIKYLFIHLQSYNHKKSLDE